MAFSEADKDAFKAAIAKGVKKLKMGGEEVEYNSFGEMRAALRMIEAEIGRAHV